MSPARWLWPYQPITARLVFILAATSLISALLRGVDYIVLPQDELSLSIAENALPIQDWGALLVLGVTMSVSGYVVHRWPVTILGHALLVGIFCAFGIGDVLAGLHHIAGHELRTGATYLLTQMVVHALLTLVAWRRWDAARG